MWRTATPPSEVSVGHDTLRSVRTESVEVPASTCALASTSSARTGCGEPLRRLLKFPSVTTLSDPFALSLSKCLHQGRAACIEVRAGFDKLSPNGMCRTTAPSIDDSVSHHTLRSVRTELVEVPASRCPLASTSSARTGCAEPPRRPLTIPSVTTLSDPFALSLSKCLHRGAHWLRQAQPERDVQNHRAAH